LTASLEHEPELENPMSKRFYVVHTYSGYENRVKQTIEERIRQQGLEEEFGEVLIPTEQVVEMVRGERRTSKRKFFPGYILVEMEMNPKTWHLVRTIPRVSGFVGGRQPEDIPPVSKEEVERLTSQMTEGALKPKPKVQFENGDTVRVVDGPFAGFNGTVEEVSPEKGRLRVLVSIFGRATPVELDFMQVEKSQ
jgi:transcriptional antiterminator NusG